MPERPGNRSIHSDGSHPVNSQKHRERRACTAASPRMRPGRCPPQKTTPASQFVAHPSASAPPPPGSVRQTRHQRGRSAEQRARNTLIGGEGEQHRAESVLPPRVRNPCSISASARLAPPPGHRRRTSRPTAPTRDCVSDHVDGQDSAHPIAAIIPPRPASPDLRHAADHMHDAVGVAQKVLRHELGRPTSPPYASRWNVSATEMLPAAVDLPDPGSRRVPHQIPRTSWSRPASGVPSSMMRQPVDRSTTARPAARPTHIPAPMPQTANPRPERASRCGGRSPSALRTP